MGKDIVVDGVPDFAGKEEEGECGCGNMGWRGGEEPLRDVGVREFEAGCP